MKFVFFERGELLDLLKDSEANLYRPDINDGVIRWWLRNEWVHDGMCEPSKNDGPINEVIISKLSKEKAT